MITAFHEHIGDGGTGTVWRATDDVHGNVAVKFFHQAQYLNRNEVVEHAKLLSSINHPCVVRIHDVCRELARPSETAQAQAVQEPALIMEYVPGQSYADWMGLPNKTIEAVRRVVLDMLDGLEAFHIANLTHGDLHAQNIRVTPDGRAKLIDPLHRSTEFILTSALTRERRRKDIGEAKYLISQTISQIVVSTELVGRIAALNSAQDTVAELRALVEQIPVESTASALVTIDYYDLCRNCQSRGDLAGWQEAHKSASRAIVPQLQAWRKDLTPVPQDMDGKRRAIYDAIHRCRQTLSILLASSEFPDSKYAVAISSMSDIVDIEWERSGIPLVAQIADGLFYAFHYFVGSSACLNDNQAALNRISKLRIARPGRAELFYIYECSEYCGWSPVLDKDLVQSMDLLRHAYSFVDPLRRVFVSEKKYHVGLTAYSLFLLAMELSRRQKPGYQNPQTAVMPLAMFMPGQIRRAAMVKVFTPENFAILGLQSADEIQKFRIKWKERIGELEMLWRNHFRIHDIEDLQQM